MKQFLNEQTKKLTELLNPVQFVTVQAGYVLHKLPVMGVQGNKSDFEWPSKEEWDKMQGHENLSLKSLEIWHGDKGYYEISGLRATLSNGMQSPYY